MTTKPKPRKAPAAKRYDAFVAKIMEPLPAEQLVDIAYNRQARDMRRPAWSHAENKTGAWRSLKEYYYCLALYQEDEGELELARDATQRSLEGEDSYREAAIQQMRTPAPDPNAVAWKKKHVTWLQYHMPMEEINAAIAADEAFLEAHPVGYRKRVTS